MRLLSRRCPGKST